MDSDTSIQMRWKKSPEEVGEYTLVQRKPGYPKATRTNWTFAAEDVLDAPAANLPHTFFCTRCCRHERNDARAECVISSDSE